MDPLETLEVSSQIKTTSLSLPSPNATHVASLSGARLQIRFLATLEVVRSIPLPSSHDLRTSKLAWSPLALPYTPPNFTPPRRKPQPTSNRILVHDDEATRIYDLRDEKWNALISNGSGGMGKNVHVQFGANEDEVLVWSDFGSKMTVWCLRTGRTAEVRDPKFVGREGRGWGYRPSPKSPDEEAGVTANGRGAMLAILCRGAGHDILLLLAPKTYKVIKRVELATTDAQDLKWDPNGRWLAIHDSPSSGFKLHIYTTDGHLYRSINREPPSEPLDWNIEGLGIKSVDWVPGSEYLAVGGWDRRVRLLSSRTFAPIVFLDHTPTIHIPDTPVYTEHVDGRGGRRYELSQQPVTPPAAVPEKGDVMPRQGISILAINNDGTMCATRDDSCPTTVWVWDLRSLVPKTILVQHSPIKTLRWHPSDALQLFIQCTHDAPVVYLYTFPAPAFSSSNPKTDTIPPPTILDLSNSVKKPASSTPTKWTGAWLATQADKKPCFTLGHNQGFILVWPQGRDQILRFENGDGDESEDSLYDILTGRTPIPQLRDSMSRSAGSEDGMMEGTIVEETIEGSYEEESSGVVALDDTFRSRRERDRRGVSGGEGRGQSVFDESGMSEMF